MKASVKDIVRTIKKESKRLLGFAIITALGVTMTAGLRAACDDLRASADSYYDMQNMHDIEIISTLGLTDDDLNDIQKIDGVERAVGVYSEELFVDIPGGKSGADVAFFEANGLDEPYIVEGRMPEKPDEALVTKGYLMDTGKSIGDTLVLTEELEEAEENDSGYPELDSLYETEKPNFKYSTYTITGVCTDVNSTINPEGPTAAFRLSGTENYSIFVLKEAVETEVYTSVRLTVAGAKELDTFSEDYDSVVGKVKSYIENEVKPVRERERFESVRAEATEKIDDAEKTLDDVFADADKEIADGRRELDNGWAELRDGQNELNKNAAELAANEKELLEKEKELLDGEKEIADNEAELSEGIAKVQKVIDDNRALLDQGMNEIKENEKTLIDAKTQLSAGINQATTALEGLLAQKAQLEAVGYPVPAELLMGISQAENAIEGLNTQMAEVEAGLSIIDDKKLEVGKAYANLEAGQRELNNQEKEARAQLEEAKAEIEDGKKQIEDGKAQIEDGKKQLLEAQETINDGYRDLKKGEIEFADSIKEYNEKKADAKELIEEARGKINDIDRAVWYVRDRHVINSFADLESDADTIQSIGTIFPIMFLVIALLISLTTISRMVEEDRGLIGTYQALGFHNNEIRRKYISFSTVACIIGGILGNICGVFILPEIVFVIFKEMYLLPKMLIVPDFTLGLLGTAIFLGAILLTTFVVTSGTLKHMPATLMRPKAPEAGTRIFLEYIKPIWTRMSFLRKVTARNLFRYKKRLFMTVFGIMGCTGLLVCGFTLRDTVGNLTVRQFGHVIDYDILALNRDKDDNKRMMKYIDNNSIFAEADSLRVESVEIFGADGDSMSMQLFIIEDGEKFSDYMGITSLDGEKMSIDGSGAVITENAARLLGFSEGDSITLRSMKLVDVNVKVVGVAENYLGNYVFISDEFYNEIFEEYEPNAAIINLSDDANPYEAADALGKLSSVMTLSSVQRLVDGFSGAFILMNLVVYVVLVMAAALAFVVLFTLSNTNISERERELATIKVLGFHDKEVHSYANRETVILTIMGIIPGLILGKFLGILLMNALHLNGVNFAVITSPLSYVLSGVVAFAFMIIVNMLTNRTLNKINPIEALKSIE